MEYMFIITGGGTGIGRALALALASSGQRVLIIGRREAPLLEVARQNAHIQILQADVSTTEGRQQIKQSLSAIHQVSGLIHNAATVEPVARLGQIDESVWRQALMTNVDAPLFLTQLLQDKLKQGRVLHIGSGAAYFPIAGWTAYCVSKAALAMMVRCWQEEKSLVVASVMPGIIDTDLLAHACRHNQQMDMDKLNFFNQLRDQGRLLRPETVAIFLRWLLLDIHQEQFMSCEWDIYDESHHHHWLTPPHVVYQLE